MTKNDQNHDVIEDAAGLTDDPVEMVVMTEIAIIQHLSENLFQRYLPDDLTVAQFGVLNHLLRLDRQETITELASAMQVAPPTMSSTVRKLEDKGLVKLIADAKDRRIRRVCVTPSGAKQRNHAIASTAPIAALFREKFPEEHFDALLPGLVEIRKFLDQLRN